MICMEICRSGVAIGTVAIQRVCCETLWALRLARFGSTVAAAGAAAPGSCGRRTGTGTRRTTGTTSWASVSVPRFYSQKRSETEVAGRPARSQAGRATGAERSCHWPTRGFGCCRGCAVQHYQIPRTTIAPRRRATFRTARSGRARCFLKPRLRGWRSTGLHPRPRCPIPEPS